MLRRLISKYSIYWIILKTLSMPKLKRHIIYIKEKYLSFIKKTIQIIFLYKFSSLKYNIIPKKIGYLVFPSQAYL